MIAKLSKHIEVGKLISDQREYFMSHETKDVDFRIRQLRQLKTSILKFEEEIREALYTDLRKGKSEAYLTEIDYVIKEIDVTVSRLRQWAQPESKYVPPLLWTGNAAVHFQPYGCVLIISPWNYPFQLLMLPLIGVIAAGNTAIVKPSEFSEATSIVIEKILNDAFPKKYIDVVQGGVEETQALLQERFDFICFTGSTHVGRIVYLAAAKYLTPVLLELGGQCPVIIDKNINPKIAAKRIIFGKLMNAGQTCLAPNHIFCHKDVEEPLLDELIKATEYMYTNDPKQSTEYGRIINTKHFDRISALIDADKVRYGGTTDRNDLYIAPTFMTGVTMDDPVMQDEIFGPLLPIISIDSVDDAISTINSMEKPLALYAFSKSKKVTKKILRETSSGGVSINDTIWHHNVRALPFGGVGESGIGNYQGKYSFDTFSHSRAVFKQGWLADPALKFPPFEKRLSWLRKLVHWLG